MEKRRALTSGSGRSEKPRFYDNETSLQAIVAIRDATLGFALDGKWLPRSAPRQKLY